MEDNTEEQTQLRRERETAERLEQIDRLEHAKRIRQLEKELEQISQVPPDPASRRRTWLAERIAAAEMDCKTIAETYARQSELIEKIKNDKAFPPDEIERAVDVIDTHFESIRLQIQQGDIRI